MTSTLYWQKPYFALLHSVFTAKFACYPRCFLTSYFCIPVPYNEKNIMQNAGLDEAQAGIKIARRNINKHKYADDTTLMAESEEELRIFLIEMKKESEKLGLKLNIQKTKITASGPIISCEIDGETTEIVTDFIFLAPKSLQMVTAAMKLKDTCSLKEKL